eukprot:5128930-Heterocapsa_arctica.AAC.1
MGGTVSWLIIARAPPLRHCTCDRLPIPAVLAHRHSPLATPGLGTGVCRGAKARHRKTSPSLEAAATPSGDDAG